MRVYGCASVSEFLGDRIVYRNLEPVDPRLPALRALQEELGRPAGAIPRKQDPEYAQAVSVLLRRARALDAPGIELKRLVFLGDTRLSDGGAFTNLCLAGGWAGRAFIGAETAAPPAMETLPAGPGDVFLSLANRWAALDDFDRRLVSDEFMLDEATAVVVDLDKTAIGARGRNAHVIDAARLQAVFETVAGLLGQSFDPEAFKSSYRLFGQPEFHPFTADNQDYLAYLCLILGSGLVRQAALVEELRAGRLVSFQQFIESVEAQSVQLSPGLAGIHREILANVRAGDPTPFKAFRRNEYLATLAGMGCLPDSSPVEEILAGEIAITQEVRRAALKWQSQGALLFGLSDKPDEASLPTPEQAEQGFVPLHRQETHAVGE
jgi:hypothetical protein